MVRFAFARCATDLFLFVFLSPFAPSACHQPLVRKDVIALCHRLAALPGLKTLAMTTNGLTLKRQLPQLKAAGVTHLNISLDTLQADKFEKIARRKGFERVLEAVHGAVEHGFKPVKVRGLSS